MVKGPFWDLGVGHRMNQHISSHCVRLVVICSTWCDDMGMTPGVNSGIFSYLTTHRIRPR